MWTYSADQAGLCGHEQESATHLEKPDQVSQEKLETRTYVMLSQGWKVQVLYAPQGGVGAEAG